MKKRWTAPPYWWCWVWLGLAWLLLAMPVQAAEPGLKARQQTLLNRDWRFMPGDPADAAAPTLDDRHWQPVHLPHSFSLPSFGAGADFFVGEGWYRRRLERPAAWQSKRIHLEFEAAFQVAEVCVNGRHVGRHEGGYTGFSVDITDALATATTSSPCA